MSFRHEPFLTAIEDMKRRINADQRFSALDSAEMHHLADKIADRAAAAFQANRTPPGGDRLKPRTRLTLVR